MLKFLRYNGRHSLYHGDKGFELNPICSSSHRKDGTRTGRWHEPMWLFKLRQRMFAFDSRQRCGRRDEGWHGRTDEQFPDTWDVGPDGNRTCSWCGSCHPEDMLEICRKTLVDERYAVEKTDKRYKVYLKQPGVQNAGQGAIKFYMAHAPENPTEADQQLFADAVRVSWERFEARFRERRNG